MRLHLRGRHGYKYKIWQKSNEENPQAIWKRVDRFIGVFKERWGAVTCRELTGLDVKTAEGIS